MKNIVNLLNLLEKHFPTKPKYEHYITYRKDNYNEIILHLSVKNKEGKFYYITVSVEGFDAKTPEAFVKRLKQLF